MKSRKHLVSFRVTEEELEILRTVSLKRGCRSISGFMRDVLLGAAEAESEAESSISPRLALLENRLEALESKFGPMADLVQNVLNRLASENNIALALTQLYAPTHSFNSARHMPTAGPADQ